MFIKFIMFTVVNINTNGLLMLALCRPELHELEVLSSTVLGYNLTRTQQLQLKQDSMFNVRLSYDLPINYDLGAVLDRNDFMRKDLIELPEALWDQPANDVVYKGGSADCKC